MALLNLLSIARSALTTHQRALEVTGHNIANANTEGYTRQRLIVEPLTPERTSYGTIGRGVTIDTIRRMRDQFLDVRFREERALLGRHDAMSRRLSEIEGIVGEPSDSGLAATIDAFMNAFGDLANDPSGGAARTLVQHQGRQVADALNRMAGRIAEIAQEARQQVDVSLRDVNQLATEIAGLNTQIVEVEANGGTAGDMRDRRDLAIDRIAQLLPARVVENPNGSDRILVGDVLLVDQGIAQQLTLRAGPGTRTGLGLVGGTNYFEPSSGELSGLLEVVNDRVPGVTQTLDTLARGIVTEVNALHQSGINGLGQPGGEFFDGTGLTARTIRLSVPVSNSVDAIVAGATGAAGDGSIALAIGQLRNQGVVSLNGISIHEFLTQMVSGVGVATQTSARVAEAQDVLVTNIEGQRSAAHDVSVDEEMVTLITHQQAYAAAARIVNVADEMVRELLNMI